MAYGSEKMTISGPGLNKAPELRIDAFNNRFEHALSDLQTLQGRVGNISDRLMGSVPEEAGQASAPQPSASLAKAESMVEGLEYLLTRLRRNVDRLDTL